MELDKFIKMIPGHVKKRININLAILGKAFMGEDASGDSGGNAGLETTDGVPTRVMGTDPRQGPTSGGEGDSGSGGGGGGGM
jgi:hypothetical protein